MGRAAKWLSKRSDRGRGWGQTRTRKAEVGTDLICRHIEMATHAEQKGVRVGTDLFSVVQTGLPSAEEMMGADPMWMGGSWKSEMGQTRTAFLKNFALDYHNKRKP